MATVQQLLDDINLRYRNSFQTSQILVWMNEEQRELFEIIELDSVPFSFSTVKGQYLYPIPTGVEKDRIKAITYQMDTTTSPNYLELSFKENDNHQYASESDYWYTFVEMNFYLNIPGGTLDGRTVYIYPEQQPDDMTSANLNIEPAVPVRHQELLKLGTLKRIAAARKDVEMYNNYHSDHLEKLTRLRKKMALQQPNYQVTKDVMSKRTLGGGRRGRTVDWSLIPY